MRMFDLRYEPGPNFGFMSTTGSGALVRGAGGRVALTLQAPGSPASRTLSRQSPTS